MTFPLLISNMLYFKQHSTNDVYPMWIRIRNFNSNPGLRAAVFYYNKLLRSHSLSLYFSISIDFKSILNVNDTVVRIFQLKLSFLSSSNIKTLCENDATLEWVARNHLQSRHIFQFVLRCFMFLDHNNTATSILSGFLDNPPAKKSFVALLVLMKNFNKVISIERLYQFN